MTNWRGRKARLWLFFLVTAGVAIGVVVGLLQRGTGATTAVSALAIVAGLFLMSPRAVKPGSDDTHRDARRLCAALGASSIVGGVSQLVPNMAARLMLSMLNFVLLFVVMRHARQARRRPL